MKVKVFNWSVRRAYKRGYEAALPERVQEACNNWEDEEIVSYKEMEKHLKRMNLWMDRDERADQIYTFMETKEPVMLTIRLMRRIFREGYDRILEKMEGEYPYLKMPSITDEEIDAVLNPRPTKKEN